MSDKDPKVTRANRPALELHVPEPRFRPGDTPDFSNVVVPAAGTAPRPDSSAEAADTHALATDLVRVLDDNGRAVGPWDPKLDPDINERGLDLMSPIWHVLDLTPQGRGNWYAGLDYGSRVQRSTG